MSSSGFYSVPHRVGAHYTTKPTDRGMFLEKYFVAMWTHGFSSQVYLKILVPHVGAPFCFFEHVGVFPRLSSGRDKQQLRLLGWMSLGLRISHRVCRKTVSVRYHPYPTYIVCVYDIVCQHIHIDGDGDVLLSSRV